MAPRTKARQVTMCPACEETVGCRAYDSYNRHPRDRYGRDNSPKIVPHKGPDGRRCRASGYTVHPNVVMDREVEA